MFPRVLNYFFSNKKKRNREIKCLNKKESFQEIMPGCVVFYSSVICATSADLSCRLTSFVTFLPATWLWPWTSDCEVKEKHIIFYKICWWAITPSPILWHPLVLFLVTLIMASMFAENKIPETVKGKWGHSSPISRVNLKFITRLFPVEVLALCSERCRCPTVDLETRFQGLACDSSKS